VKAERSSKRYGEKHTAREPRAQQAATTQPQGTDSDGHCQDHQAGPSLHLPTPIPALPCPCSALAPGQGEPVPWPAEQLRELCPRSHSPCLAQRIKLQIHYQGKGALPSHQMHPNSSARGRRGSSQEPFAAEQLPGTGPWQGRATQGRSSHDEEQHSALLFPSVLRVPSSKPSPPLRHKQCPFPRVPSPPDVLETPSRAHSKERHRSAEREQGGDPRAVARLRRCPFL